MGNGITYELREKRTNTINYLKILYYLNQIYDRGGIIEALISATKLPTTYPYNNDLLLLVLENTLAVVTFFNDISRESNHDLQQKIRNCLYDSKERSVALSTRDDLKQTIKSIKYDIDASNQSLVLLIYINSCGR